GMVFLHEPHIDPVLPQQLLAKDLGEKAARIEPANRLDLFHLGNSGGNDLHRAKVLNSAAKLKHRRLSETLLQSPGRESPILPPSFPTLKCPSGLAKRNHRAGRAGRGGRSAHRATALDGT